MQQPDYQNKSIAHSRRNQKRDPTMNRDLETWVIQGKPVEKRKRKITKVKKDGEQ